MRRKGFTLVEIILAIALISLIAGIFIPAITFGFINLMDSEKYTREAYQYQQEVERLLELKRSEAFDGTDEASFTVFGVSVTGHVVQQAIENHGNIYAVQPQRIYVFEELFIIPKGHAGNPAVKLETVGISPTPITVNLFQSNGAVNNTINLLADNRHFTVNNTSIFLVNVYKWYVTSVTAYDPTFALDNYFVIKEWNAARKPITYSEALSLNTVPNIQNSPDYNTLTFNEVKNGYVLSDTDLINTIGNRFIYYSVVPYATSGRIGKESLSNAIYISAPKIEISSARFTANENEVEITFVNDVGSSFFEQEMFFNATLGNIVGVTKHATDNRIVYITFDGDADRFVPLGGNKFSRGAVHDAVYGAIDIWSSNQPSGNFTIASFDGIVPVNGIEMSPNTSVKNIGESLQLTTTILPSNASNTAVTWTSSDTSVATVNSTGLVTAVSAGSVQIIAQTVDGGFEDYCELTVLPQSLVLKLQADNGVNQSGGRVSAWNDQSGFNRHFAQATSTNRPGYVSNYNQTGLEAVTFSGNQALFIGASQLDSVTFDTKATSEKFTLFIVGQANTSSNPSTFFSKSGGWGTGATYAFGRLSNGSFAHRLQGVENASAGDGLMNVHTSQWNGTTHQYYYNGVARMHDTKNNVTDQSNNITIGGTAGSNSGAGNYLNGAIHEVRVYQGELSDANRQLIENELTDKWLSLRTWYFDRRLENWTDAYRLGNITLTEEGTLRATIQGTGAYMGTSSGLNIDTSKATRVQIRLKNSTGATQGRIDYRIGNSPTYYSVSFPIAANSDFTTYIVDMTGAQWSGTLNQLRVYPAYNITSGSVEIEFIRIVR